MNCELPLTFQALSFSWPVIKLHAWISFKNGNKSLFSSFLFFYYLLWIGKFSPILNSVFRIFSFFFLLWTHSLWKYTCYILWTIILGTLSGEKQGLWHFNLELVPASLPPTQSPAAVLMGLAASLAVVTLGQARGQPKVKNEDLGNKTAQWGFEKVDVSCWSERLCTPAGLHSYTRNSRKSPRLLFMSDWPFRPFASRK